MSMFAEDFGSYLRFSIDWILLKSVLSLRFKCECFEHVRKNSAEDLLEGHMSTAEQARPAIEIDYRGSCGKDEES